MAELDAPAGIGSTATVLAILERAIFDVAVVQALTPLRPFERAQLLDRHVLPVRLNDPRVLSAISLAPAALVPLRADELAAIAEIAQSHCTTSPVQPLARNCTP